MPQYLVTIGFLVAAIVCYAAGSMSGALFLAAIGFILEAVFWIRVLVRRRSPTLRQSS